MTQSYINLLRDAFRRKQAGQGRLARAQAGAGYNTLYGGGTTQSGGLRSATEGIARQEGSEATGHEAYLRGLEMQMQEEQKLRDEAKRQEEKQRKWGLWGGLADKALGMIPFGSIGKSLLGALKGKTAEIPEVPNISQGIEQQISPTIPQMEMTEEYNVNPLANLFTGDYLLKPGRRYKKNYWNRY